MSNVARAQQGLGSEQLGENNKNEHLPTHDFHIGQNVMYLNPLNSRRYPATIRNLAATRSGQMMVSHIEKHRII